MRYTRRQWCWIWRNLCLVHVYKWFCDSIVNRFQPIAIFGYWFCPTLCFFFRDESLQIVIFPHSSLFSSLTGSKIFLKISETDGFLSHRVPYRSRPRTPRVITECSSVVYNRFFQNCIISQSPRDPCIFASSQKHLLPRQNSRHYSVINIIFPPVNTEPKCSNARSYALLSMETSRAFLLSCHLPE